MNRCRRYARAARLPLLLLTAGALASAAVFVCLPLPPGLLDYRKVASVRILDREGGLLRELSSRADGRSTPLAAGEIPPQVRAAFIAAEDKGFYRHLGLSPSAVLRAAWQNLAAGRVVSGGSTLTQQLARNLVPRERTFAGKLKEALWAVRLELHLSKEELLTQYLNRVSFGNNAFGIEAAAQLYFGRRANCLSVAQAAVLAAIPRGPSAYNPYRQPERLRVRKEWILGRMGKLGLLDASLAESAKREPLDLEAFTAAFRAPHFVEYLAQNLERWGLGEATVIETSLDPRLQAAVEDQIAQELSRLEERHVSSAAALVVDNATGEVLAYQGSASFFDAEILGQNDGIQMKRQPGSALKPFIYAEAFGAGYTPATVIADLDSQFGARKGAYAPKNYDRRTHGPVRVREALGSSYNVPAVRVADELGSERVLKALRRAGFESLGKDSGYYGLGLVLGNGEVTLWEAARAYAGLSRGGVVKPLWPIRRALRADGSELPLRAELASRRFAGETSAGLVAHILSDNVARARAFGLDNALRLPFTTAAKTGTSKGYSDNWTLGFTRERTVAVWAGNFDGSPMIQVSGITGAGPIFKRVMTRAMAGLQPAPLVDLRGLERETICPLSGERASPSCPAAMEELFAAGTAPKHRCSMHAEVAQGLPRELDARCRTLAGGQGRVTDLGPDFYEWQRAEGLAKEPWLASACTGVESEGASGDAPVLLSPAGGDEFLLISDLPLADQSIPLRVRARPSQGAIEVRLDGALVMVLQPPFTGRIPATAGEHLLSLHRPGEIRATSEARFRVRGGKSVF
ncbi:MAG: penicillin-binding protein 1C [Myxococcaceae bacterium]